MPIVIVGSVDGVHRLGSKKQSALKKQRNSPASIDILSDSTFAAVVKPKKRGVERAEEDQ